jgi:methionyl-tRNA formyltransferase
VLATEHGLTVEQPQTLRDTEARDRLAAFAADLMVVAAYGLILPAPILAIPAGGCINVHASLLPRWRGAAPIERAIEAGDAQTGVTIMQMDEGLDTGDILLARSLDIMANDTGDTLRERLAVLGAEALCEALSKLRQGELTAAPQASGASYAAKLQSEEARIDWHQDAQGLARRVRAFVSARVCFSELQGERIRVWQGSPQANNAAEAVPGQIISADGDGIVVACSRGALRLERLQLPGGKILSARELLNSKREMFAPGLHFGTTGSV